MLTLSYKTKSNIELANAVIVVTNINQNIRTAVSESLDTSNLNITTSDDASNEVDFRASVYRDIAALKEEKAKEVEALSPSSMPHDSFRFNFDEVDGSSLREKCYNHLLSLTEFKTASIIEGESL